MGDYLTLKHYGKRAKGMTDAGLDHTIDERTREFRRRWKSYPYEHYKMINRVVTGLVLLSRPYRGISEEAIRRFEAEDDSKTRRDMETVEIHRLMKASIRKARDEKGYSSLMPRRVREFAERLSDII
ncbi:MAG: hypothetical protein KGH64_00495 [Candidatus Micrarchaeota archaeon]|nr:hypothetical protein [Candidatus Micrarchaeota archaeon]MDE1833795.1 hypothetical protein [Candidatus Micrarchaeota archaeon]MDE1859595.1 hypothetical protein [Candidatus Micrarchaeota archaeon]